MPIHPVRQRIRDIALAESDARHKPFGRVTDQHPPAGSYRYGWERLKEYFDTAMLTPPNWDDHTKHLFVLQIKGYPPQEYQVSNLEGIQLPNRRVPQNPAGNDGLGIQWCGIFATWVLIQAGVPAKWKTKIGIRGGVTPDVTDRKGIQIGDVCVVHGETNHHLVACEINETQIMGVNGNSLYQSILYNPVNIRNISQYYRINL
jgi:hypothetical protein